MGRIIGREIEQNLLREAIESDKAELVAVYGRRRIGKTFLVKQMYEKQFAFYTTGIYNGTKAEQLAQFNRQLCQYSGAYYPPVKNWFDAFEQLKQYLSSLDGRRAIILLDEMPWMDTPSSRFIKAFDLFWNGWAADHSNIKLIVCGSATTWMMDNIVTNKGGLYNRSTRKIKLSPFNLNECEDFLKTKGIVWNHYQIAECYMIFGGVPYYFQALHKGMSVSQNIDFLFFRENAELRNEYDLLIRSLFKKTEIYKRVISILGRQSRGMTRKEIMGALKIPESGGSFTDILDDLVNCDFIRAYNAFGKKERDTLYQLTDLFTLFHFRYLENYSGEDEHRWSNMLDSPSRRAWYGYSFEMLCLHHIQQIKNRLGILGVSSEVCSWSVKEEKSVHPGVQIDLLIDRRDQVINLCDMKFSVSQYELTKNYLKKITDRAELFRSVTKTKKSLHLTMVTTYGLVDNMYSGMIQRVITLDNLFAKRVDLF